MIQFTKEEILEHLKRQPPEQLDRYNDFIKRGIDFTPMQMTLMFFPRQYGKTFISMCELAEEARKWDETFITFEFELGTTERTLIPNDVDITKEVHKIEYLKKFSEFLNEYYFEFKVVPVNKFKLKLIKKRLIRVSNYSEVV